MTKSRTAEKISSSRSAAMNGCHSRKRPKCTSSQMRWNSLPGAATSAACSASSIASTTQRRCAVMMVARRCAVEAENANVSPSESRRRVSGRRTTSPPGRTLQTVDSDDCATKTISYLLWHRACDDPITDGPTSRRKTMRKQQSGFTLVEIAIVLVIIGLLLGGILKGQELINSAKVKNLANDFRVIPTYIYAYQDKFKALPGDDVAVVAHLGTLVPP